MASSRFIGLVLFAKSPRIPPTITAAIIRKAAIEVKKYAGLEVILNGETATFLYK